MAGTSTFPADNGYLILALRCVTYFQAVDKTDAEWNVAFGTVPAYTGNTADNKRAMDLYNLVLYGAYFTLNVGKAPMTQGPLWYCPAGGGPSGVSSESDRHIITNGVPSQEAIVKLAKAIEVNPRQNINVQLNFFPFAVLGAGQSAANSNAIDPLLALNQFDGIKHLQFYVDGALTRDVQ